MITVDSMPAHLAGAAGVPTWLLLHSDCDWLDGGSNGFAVVPADATISTEARRRLAAGDCARETRTRTTGKRAISTTFGCCLTVPASLSDARTLAISTLGYNYRTNEGARCVSRAVPLCPRFGRSGSRKPSMCARLIVRTPSCFCRLSMLRRNFSILVQCTLGRKWCSA